MKDLKSIYQRIRSLRSILQFFEDEKLSDTYPSLVPVLAALTKRLDKVEKLNLSTNGNRRSEAKKSNRRNLANAAYHVSCGVYAYAQITGNAALKNAVQYSFSDFYRPVENTMLGRCRQLLNAVRRIKNPKDFAITPELICKLETAMKKYIDFMHEPTAEVRKHARAMKIAKSLLDECLSILQNQLDPLMVVISCSCDDQLVINGYRIKREIHKPAGRKRTYVKSGKYKKEQKQKLPVAPVLQLKVREKAISN